MSHPTSPDLDIVNGKDSFAALFECVRELIAIFDAEGTLLFVNPALWEVLDRTPIEITGKSIAQLLHEDDLDLFRTVLSRLGANLESKISIRCRLRHADGSWRWFDAEARRHPNHEPATVFSFLDITTLQRIEAERQVIFQVIHALNETSNLDQLLQHIHQALKKVLYAENCFIALHDAENDTFHFPFFADHSTSRLRLSARQKLHGLRLSHRPRHAHSAIRIRSPGESGEVELVGSPSPAWLGVPLKTPTATIGVLVVQHYENQNAYDIRDLEFSTPSVATSPWPSNAAPPKTPCQERNNFRLLFAHNPHSHLGFRLRNPEIPPGQRCRGSPIRLLR